MPYADVYGHVVGAVVQTLLAAAAVLGVAVLLGFRPGADAAGWLGLTAFVALFALMLTWLSVAIETVRGLLAGSPVEATTVWTAVAWCLDLTVVGWLWARAAYRRPSA